MIKLSKKQAWGVAILVAVGVNVYFFYLASDNVLGIEIFNIAWIILRYVIQITVKYALPLVLLVMTYYWIRNNITEESLANFVIERIRISPQRIKPAYLPAKYRPYLAQAESDVEQAAPSPQPAPVVEQTGPTEPAAGDSGRPRLEADERARERHYTDNLNRQKNYEQWLKEAKEENPNREWQDSRRSFNDILKRRPKK